MSSLGGTAVVFMAVGAGHMWGEAGLVQLLRNAGCTVEQYTY